MKPSEFWTRVLALPEQARQAEQDASDLRSSADALCEWATRMSEAHRHCIALADAGDEGGAEYYLEGLPPRPDAGVSSVIDCPMDDPPKPARKQRSDAGKPRVRVGSNKDGSPKYNEQVDRRSASPEGSRTAPLAICDSDPDPPEDDAGPPANPADVKAKDTEHVRFAGFIRAAVAAAGEPMTVGGLVVRTGLDEDDVRAGLKLLSLVSWRMQREGDSKPVEVWGTVEQFAQQVGRMSVKSGDRIADTIAKFGCSEFDARRVWNELDPRVTS